MSTTGVKVLEKALSILSWLLERGELSLKQLEKLSGFNRSTIYRILQVFQKWGYIEQHSESKKYRPSLKIVEIAGTVLRKISLLDICRPYLLDLRDNTGESSFLAILRGVNIIIIDWEPSYFDAQMNITVGKSVPAYCSGAGKAILSSLPHEELEALLSTVTLKQYTPNTITDMSVLKKVINETRAEGFGVSWGEYDPEIVVVGSPIFDIHNRVIASCAIGALKSRVKNQNQIKKYGEMINSVCSDISRKLGSSRVESLKNTIV